VFEVAHGEFAGNPAVSTEIAYDLQGAGEARGRLEALVRRLDGIAEIPNLLRGGTRVGLAAVVARST
jgi:hypothetical protein